uniref:Zgc:66448 n=1 Tax=Oryzias melastigma TaxID=30732 RepID=A0A3B3BVF8_ORYME
VEDHMMTRSNNNIFKCQECNQIFPNVMALRFHQKSHPALKPYECPECGMAFKYGSLLHQHQYLHTGQKPFCCPECGKKFAFAQNMKAHCRQHRLRQNNSFGEPPGKQTPVTVRDPVKGAGKENSHQSEEPKRAFNCPLCPQTFSVPATLRAHMLIHEAEYDKLDRSTRPPTENNKVWEKGHTCPHCPSIFREQSSLKFHCLSVHKSVVQPPEALPPSPQKQLSSDGSHKCPECGKTFRHRSVLELHMRIHSKDKPYQCKVCGKGFRFSSYLQQHLIIHTGKKPYKCPDCGKDFAFLQNMRTHQRLHQEKPNDEGNHAEKKTFTCNECGKAFSRLSALVSHQLHHPKRKPFQCSDCMMSFVHAASLFNHKKTCTAQQKDSISSNLRLRKGVPGTLQSVNGRSRSCVKVACPVCGRKFRHKGTMTLHMRKHENGSHQCELCSRTFRLFSSLLRHQVVHSEQLLPPPIKSFQHQMEQLRKNTYSCPDCGKLFSRAKALQFHMKCHGYETDRSPSPPQSSAAPEGLQCVSCLSYFNTESSDEIKEMTKNNETDADFSLTKMKYKCNKCDREFPVVGALNFHKRIHAENHQTSESDSAVSPLKNLTKVELRKELFHCPDCGRRFMTNSALGSHRRWHREKKCSRHFLKEEDSKSVGSRTEEGPFQVLQRHQLFNCLCQPKPECESSISAGDDGRSEVTLDPTFQQVLWIKSESEGVEVLKAADGQPTVGLLGHTSVQSDGESKTLLPKPKAYQCPLCPMTFAKARGLRAHKWQAHSKVLNAPPSAQRAALTCQDCGLTFTHLSTYNTHLHQHSLEEEEVPTGEHGSPKVCVKEEDLDVVESSLAETFLNPLAGNAGRNQGYVCKICGKAYKYVLSYRKHLSTHKNKNQKEKSQSDHLRKYECPDCGMSFIRRTRLISHLRVHRAREAVTIPKCDQCNKKFTSARSWLSHLQIHKERQFWCLSCSQGYLDEVSLDKHLQLQPCLHFGLRADRPHGASARAAGT